MVVQRRSLEDSMLSRLLETVSSLPILEHEALQDDGYHLGDEHSSHQQQQKLGFEQDRHRCQRATERQRTGIAHEYFRGMGVVPEESYTRSHQRGTEHG